VQHLNPRFLQLAFRRLVSGELILVQLLQQLGLGVLAVGFEFCCFFGCSFEFVKSDVYSPEQQPVCIERVLGTLERQWGKFYYCCCCN
jgi:hypothetical protein